MLPSFYLVVLRLRFFNRRRCRSRRRRWGRYRRRRRFRADLLSERVAGIHIGIAEVLFRDATVHIMINVDINSKLITRFRENFFFTDEQILGFGDFIRAGSFFRNNHRAGFVFFACRQCLSIDDNVYITLAALCLLVFGRVCVDIKLMVGDILKLKIDMVCVNRCIQPFVDICRRNGMALPFYDFNIREYLQDGVVERCADLTDTAAVLLCQGIAAENTVGELPTIGFRAVSDDVVEAEGFAGFDHLFVDSGGCLLNVKRAVWNDCALIFCVFCRTFEIIGRCELRNLCEIRLNIGHRDGGLNRRQGWRQRGLPLTRVNCLLDQRNGGSNVQTKARRAFRILRGWFSAAGEVHGDAGVHGRLAGGLIDRINSGRKRGFVYADLGGITLVCAAGKRLLDDLVEVGGDAHVGASDGCVQLRAGKRNRYAFHHRRFVGFQLRTHFVNRFAGDVHAVDGDAVTEFSRLQIDLGRTRAAIDQNDHGNDNQREKRDAHARKNHLAKQATEKAGIYADVPPQLPAKLPKLIKLLTSKVPADFKAAVAMAVFPALAAHLKGVTFRYTDNQVHEAAMMNLLIAAMSSGKSLVNGPIDCIIEDLVQMDKVNRQKEQDWKDEVNTMGDNKKKPVRPEDICIRIVSPDLTRAAYIQRLDDVQKAGDAYLYCKMDEVDMLRKFNDPSQLIRLCWDNSEDGQERVGTKSVTARVKTRFNWNASSTIAVTQKFFSVREVADGAVSRLSLATIIRPDFAPRPEVGSYDAQFKSQLSPYIQQLNAASGFKECRKARQLIERLENEIMEMAQLAYNKPYAEFAKRGLANGFRRAMVLYLANGEKWEKAIEDFIVWSVKYDLWCKMRFFGNQMQEAIDADSRSVCHTPGVSNLLLYVHDTFDKTEIQNICQVHGTKTKLAILLCNWKKRGFIMKNEDGTFTKTARFIAKYGHYGTPGVAA